MSFTQICSSSCLHLEVELINSCLIAIAGHTFKMTDYYIGSSMRHKNQNLSVQSEWTKSGRALYETHSKIEVKKYSQILYG